MSEKRIRLDLSILDYKKTITFIDIIFGSYCVIMLLVSILGWIQNMTSLMPAFSIAGFLVFNVILSELSRRSDNPIKLELIRSVLGPIACVLVFLGTQELYGGWWSCFLIMCIGGNILHTSLTQSPSLGRIMVIVYATTFIVTIFVLRPNSDWYMTSVDVGAIGIMGVLFVEVLLLLTKTLYSVRQNNDEITEQKAQVEEQRAIIERKGVELENTYLRLTDSIRYAKRIQTALLPLEERVRKQLPGFFVLNRPKEIVSGDFYWFSEQGPYYFFAVVDCTGHGVPGSMMTVIGNSLLNKIINENKVMEPAEVLSQVDHLLLETIQRHEVDDEVFTDGMDVGLLRIHKDTRELTYAGAKRPLVLIQNGKLTEIKGDRFSIGWSLIMEKEFTQHTYQATEGTSIYLFTDGYADQFGAKTNKKFGRQFYNLLMDVHRKETYEQHFTLDRKLKLWRGTIPQTDDVMVAGMTF